MRRRAGLQCPVAWFHFQPGSLFNRLYRHPDVPAAEPFPTLSDSWASADSRRRCKGAAGVLRCRPKVERGDMRIIVTGSNGFISWHTCTRLVEQGIDVIGVDDLSEGTPGNVVDGVRYHTLSVADAGGMVGLMREAQPEAVIHLAARPRVRFTVEQPLQSSTANLLGTITVLDSLLRAELIGKA